MKDKKGKHERVKKTNRCTIFIFQKILHIIYRKIKRKKKQPWYRVDEMNKGTGERFLFRKFFSILYT